MGRINTLEIFWSKVALVGTCLEWTGKPVNGYGQFALEGKRWRAHCLSFSLANGAIPQDLVIDHTCFNKLCVNPLHLEAVTQAENVRRYQARKTHCPHGHPYSGENLYTTPKGKRDCRTCRAAASRRRNERRKIA